MTPLDQIDSAINNAASRITNAKPSDALRANVMARISAAPAARLRAWRFGVGFAAIASVGLIAFLTWPHNHAISNFPISTPTLINPTVINPTIASNAPSPLPSVVKRARIERAANVAMSTAEIEWRARATPALAQADPLEVKALELKSIDITPLGVSPLMVPALGDGQNR